MLFQSVLASTTNTERDHGEGGFHGVGMPKMVQLKEKNVSRQSSLRSSGQGNIPVEVETIG